MFVRALACSFLLCASVIVAADEEKEEPEQAVAATLEIDDDVKAVIEPFFASITHAKVSRATVELSSESIINGAITDTQSSVYQLASKVPGMFTIYLKEPNQRTRIFCDGESMIVAVAPDAYFPIPEPLPLSEAVVELPIVMGPYPEPLLALTLAGVDPAHSFLAGMRSVELVDRDKFRGETPAVHLRGVQDDGVSWDFWLSDEKEPKPLRVLVDITPFLLATSRVALPEGFVYQLRYDFLSWRMTGEVEDKLFTYNPPQGATKYESLDAYYESLAGVAGEHPLLGQPAPELAGELLSGKEFTSDELLKKVVVIDFWASWVDLCSVSMPITKSVADTFVDKDVVYLAVNIGEKPGQVRGFLDEQKWDLPVLMDPNAKIASAFRADSLPCTMLIGRDGKVESVHIGFSGPEALRGRLTDELEVLSIGGRIGSAGQEEESESTEVEPKQHEKQPPTKKQEAK